MRLKVSIQISSFHKRIESNSTLKMWDCSGSRESAIRTRTQGKTTFFPRKLPGQEAVFSAFRYPSLDNKKAGNRLFSTIPSFPWCSWHKNLAEREGFEPSIQFYPYTRLAGERLRPARPPLHISTLPDGRCVNIVRVLFLVKRNPRPEQGRLSELMAADMAQDFLPQLHIRQKTCRHSVFSGKMLPEPGVAG